MAGSAAVAQAARSVAARAGEAETHRARRLRDAAATVGFGADRVRAALGAGAVAGGADFLARNVEPHLRAFDRLPEIDAEPVLQIVALGGLGRFLGAVAEPLIEDVLEIGRRRRGG